MDYVVKLTGEDCARGVHYFQCGLHGRGECGHQREYKQCKNCERRVWTPCERCIQAVSVYRPQNVKGGKAKSEAIRLSTERGRQLIAEARRKKPQNER